MLKKINGILNIIMGSSVGVFIGHGIYVYWDYKVHPGIYAMQSAPWYTSILTYGLFTMVVLAAVIMIKLMIRLRLKQQ
jgi:hypothetical protein